MRHQDNSWPNNGHLKQDVKTVYKVFASNKQAISDERSGPFAVENWIFWMRHREDFQLHLWQQNQIFFDEMSGLFWAEKLGIWNEMSGQFPRVWAASKPEIFNETSGPFAVNNQAFVTRCRDSFQPCKLQQNQIFLMRHEDDLQLCQWQKKRVGNLCGDVRAICSRTLGVWN